jgi:hypothetical protein
MCKENITGTERIHLPSEVTKLFQKREEAIKNCEALEISYQMALNQVKEIIGKLNDANKEREVIHDQLQQRLAIYLNSNNI